MIEGDRRIRLIRLKSLVFDKFWVLDLPYSSG